MKAKRLWMGMAVLAAMMLAGLSTRSRATEVSIELPPETGTYRKAPGVELAQTFCIQCHSVEYTAIQPSMPRKFWETEVAKMRDTYFAPVPKEMDAKIVDYLVKAYGKN